MRSWLDSPGAALGALLVIVSSARAEPTFFAERVAPLFDKHCVTCHGPEKQKGGLRLDSLEHVMHGAKAGPVLAPGDLKESELFRRITLPADDDEAMPADGKPPLTADEIKILELWIAAGASATKPLADFPTAPAPKPVQAAPEPLAPDWRPHAQEIARLEKELGLKLVPRSQIPTDGLILRTASSSQRCDDAALAKLAPVAELIVDAEMARTEITDAGLQSVGTWRNLRSLDLTRTAITSGGLAALARLKQLATLNLTETRVDDSGVAHLQSLPALKRIWLFGTKATDRGASASLTGSLE